ncbi:response regulator [soil metagenome]
MACYSPAVASPQSAAQIRLLLVEDVPQVSQYIRNLLAVQATVKLLDVVTDGRLVLDQIRELGPDVVIVDALLQGKVGGLQVAQLMRDAGIDLPIITLTVPQKPIAVSAGMGVTRVLSMPFSGFEFMNLLQEVHAEHRSLAPEAFSRVVAVYGAKGGVGTTTLAYNLAVAIARTNPYRVVLVDGSLQFADLRALLRVPPDAPSIIQLPTDRIQRTDLDEVVYRDRAGIDILLAPPRVELSEMISPRDIEKIVSLLRRSYNVVVIDTPTTVSDALLAFLDGSDLILQVLTYETAALHQARAMAETFAAIGYPAQKMLYVLNRSDAAGGLPADIIEQQFGRPPDFQIVSDGLLVLAANNRAEAFVLTSPDAPISAAVFRIAQALTGALAGAGKAVN